MPGRPALVVAGALACACAAAPAAAQEIADTGMFTATLRALAHLDWRREGRGTGDFDLRRARLGIDGRVLERIDYELVHDFRNRDAPWRDAYVNIPIVRALEVRAGRFKVPFSAEALTGVSQLTFIHRSLAATHLAPARDTGAMAHGRLFGRTTRYQAGLFTSGGDNTRRVERRDPRHGALAAGRITVRPFRRSDSERGLAAFVVAVAGTAGPVPEGNYSLTAETLRGDPLFPTVTVRGLRRRLGADVGWRNDAVELAAEWMRVIDQRLHQGVDDGRLSDVVADGWQISATAPLRIPRTRNRKPPVELAARFEELAFGRRARGTPVVTAFVNPRADVLPRSRNRAVTTGVTWYAHTHRKVQANLVRERRVEGAARAAPAWMATVRLQVSI